MIVVGGTYVERCELPYWNQIYGSGLRAAIALSSLSSGCALHSYVNRLWSEDVEATLETFGITSNLSITEEQIAFDYLYGFDNLTTVDPEKVKKSRSIDIKGNTVLCFGMLEGSARVSGKRVVFDPQYTNPSSFWDNGSEAENLALILNSAELVMSGIDAWPENRNPWLATDEERSRAARNIFDAAPSRHVVIVVKHSVGGAEVYADDESPINVPAFAADSFFKIGSGDVFSAAFAYAWGSQQMHTVEAARYASLCSAYYVEGRQLSLSAPGRIAVKPEVVGRVAGGIALTGSVTEANTELLRHAERSIRLLGGSADLRLIGRQEGLFDAGTADVVLALFDFSAQPTDIARLITKVGSRRLVVFWPSPQRVSAHMPNVLLTTDYATALYLALREARR